MDQPEFSQIEFDRKLDRIDRLLNDPNVPLEPSLVWSLLAEISQPTAIP